MWTQGYRYNWVFLASVLCCTVVLFPFHTLPLKGHCSLLKHHSFWLSRPSLHSSVMFSNDDCVQLTTNYCFSCWKRVIDTLHFFRFVSHICTCRNAMSLGIHKPSHCIESWIDWEKGVGFHGRWNLVRISMLVALGWLHVCIFYIFYISCALMLCGLKPVFWIMVIKLFFLPSIVYVQ